MSHIPSNDRYYAMFNHGQGFIVRGWWGYERGEERTRDLDHWQFKGFDDIEEAREWLRSKRRIRFREDDDEDLTEPY